jgi:hypothetical protein
VQARGGGVQKKVILLSCRRRDDLFLRGKEMLDNGDEAGFKKLVDAIDISPDIAYRLIIELKKKGI